ncbi:MAG TPA: hypothetical protein VGU71_07070 [Candidatus Dormibacteraeota bacterium]|nr:hypothetical protein [Candidatus Dormibacteraeota bacterium]
MPERGAASVAAGRAARAELIQWILSRDYTTAVGVFVYYVLLIGIANFIVDLLYPVLDPRLSL